jgi:hypothetical protein
MDKTVRLRSKGFSGDRTPPVMTVDSVIERLFREEDRSAEPLGVGKEAVFELGSALAASLLISFPESFQNDTIGGFAE